MKIRVENRCRYDAARKGFIKHQDTIYDTGAPNDTKIKPKPRTHLIHQSDWAFSKQKSYKETLAGAAADLPDRPGPWGHITNLISVFPVARQILEY